MNHEEYKRLHFNVAKMQKEYPNNSTCAKCGLPWSECTPHSVSTSESEGTFALCDYCWSNSDLETIKVCHKEVYFEQRTSLKEINKSMKYSLEYLMNCVDKSYFESKK